MKKPISLLIVLLIVLINACSVPPEIEKEELTTGNTVFNEDFILSIVTDNSEYSKYTPVNCYATIEYIGAESITIYHSDPLIAFGIEDNKYFDGGGTRCDVLINTQFNPDDEPIRIEFQKNGGWSENDPKANFYREFYEQKELILPKGEYLLLVNMAYSSDENDIIGTQHFFRSISTNQSKIAQTIILFTKLTLKRV